MAGRLEGKVAFITGGARGQGRAHALAMAKEGADIIVIDICRNIDSNPYPLATPDDLADVERSVKELGRRVFARVADVRERHELRDALEAGVADMGKLDTAARLLAQMKERQAAKVLAEITEPALAAQLLEKMRSMRRASANPPQSTTTQ